MEKKKLKKKEEENNIDSIWLFLLLPLLFGFDNKPSKVINIYMGDDK